MFTSTTTEVTLRRVMVLKSEYDVSLKRYVTSDDKEANFHQFSMNFVEFYVGGPAQYPVAVIEHDDGQVEVVNAEYVRFLK